MLFMNLFQNREQHNISSHNKVPFTGDPDDLILWKWRQLAHA